MKLILTSEGNPIFSAKSIEKFGIFLEETSGSIHLKFGPCFYASVKKLQFFLHQFSVINIGVLHDRTSRHAKFVVRWCARYLSSR